MVLEGAYKVEIVQNRLEIESKHLRKTVFIQHINSIELKRDPAWRYLIGGIILTVPGTLLMLNVDQIAVSLKITDQFLKFLIAAGSFFLIVFGVITIAYWWYLRRFILTIYLSGDAVPLYDRKEKPLREIYEYLLKTGRELLKDVNGKFKP
ncbi:hypothetical protein [Geoglobus acetivorans]|uniref:Uncharacterized protein n=1 Tax=Geoglobus acetivorans TaxID=565033 RepID=A0ABZ3H6V5_GEOAI|nr:hypothetical protein [Geoglobus acetivorans]